MDPQANIAEQVQIAQRVVSDSADLEAPDRTFEDVQADLERLSELVLDLDEWRSKGGFDPYSA